MSKIKTIQAREVLDSRGNPTVRAEIVCEDGSVGSAMVPSGASTGRHEAWELRDGDEKRYGGQGVLQAVKHIQTEIQAALVGKDTANQTKLDLTMIELDGTANKKRLGANAILAVSLAAARAEAVSQGLPLYLYLQQLIPKGAAVVMPVPQMNLINGGRHADNKLSIQEFQVIPIGAPTFAEALRMGAEIHHALRDLLNEAGVATGLGDEGGLAGGVSAALDESTEALTFIVRAIEKAGYIPGVDTVLGIDAAASEFYDPDNNVYTIDGASLTSQDLARRYISWIEEFPLISIEDPFHEDAWDDWVEFVRRSKSRFQVVGDDLYATNKQRIQEGIVREATNAVLIKPNQVGSLTETIQAILMTQKAGQNPVVSHRSGETADAFIADLAVATGAGQIKTGAPARSDRVAKYNRLLQIEEEVESRLGHDLQPFFGTYFKAVQRE